jgi:hypothetical protein
LVKTVHGLRWGYVHEKNGRGSDLRPQCFFCSAEKKSFLAACLKSEPAATYDICACVWEAESKLYNADERALITAYLAGDEQTKASYVKKNGAGWAQELENKAKASGAAAKASCRSKR